MKKKTEEERLEELEAKKQAKIDKSVMLQLVHRAKEKKALIIAIIDNKVIQP